MGNLLIQNSCPKSREFVRVLRGVMEYASRLHDCYFPDYVKWVEMIALCGCGMVIVAR